MRRCGQKGWIKIMDFLKVLWPNQRNEFLEARKINYYSGLGKSVRIVLIGRKEGNYFV